jgi:protease PrsW
LRYLAEIGSCQSWIVVTLDSRALLLNTWTSPDKRLEAELMDILLALVFSIFAAGIPTAIYIAIAWWLDRYEKEPLWLMSITFFWGAVPAVIVAIIASLLLDIPISVLATGQGADLLRVAFVAPVVEELAKAIPLFLIFLFYRREFDGLMDGLIYGALVGFGFSMTENVLYFLGAYADGGWGAWSVLVFFRAIVFGLNHALFTSAFGAGLGYARYATGPTRTIAPLFGLLMAMFLHGVHNLFVSLGSEVFCLVSLFSDWLGVIVWLVLVFVATRQEKRWITEELAEEVHYGILPRDQALAAASYRTRLTDRWAVAREQGFGRAHRLSKLHNAAAELGLKKRQYRLHGDRHGTGAEIQRLRGEVSQLIAELG